ncbi:MAG TPA: AAA family ATPase, partial [Myxococcaceae bacterium]|nr:AAA family ATPase [Myxococcaceae bacterium]
MLRALHISNFAVIEEAEFEGEKGLTVFTGETGAGKSILIDALGLLLGGRADADHVRAGCEEAVVEGIFTAIPTLKTRLGERGCPDLGDEVHVRRIIGRNGRGKAYVNGSLVTVGVLASLMRGLIDVAGQHEHTRLLDPTSHGEILDRVGGLENLIGAYRADFDALRGVEVEMTALGGDERQVQGRVDFLRFQLEEFERLGVDPEADAGLEDERRKLLSVEKLRRAANEAEFTVASEEGSAVERVGKALSWLSDAAKLDASLQPLAQSLRTALVELEEAGRSLSRYVASAEGDPQRLSEVEERLNALKHLCRKHATDVAGLRTRHAELTDELQRLENREGAVALLSARRLSLETTARASAARLSAARADAARRLTTAVKSGLAGLALGKSCFEVRLTAQETLTASGLDAVEFYFNANPGEPLKPLAKVASGGEASRVLLALKKAVAGSDACGCYVL